jgi:hypothetical protein
MKKNMGTIDRLVRTLLAIVIAVLYFYGEVSGIAAIVLGVIAVAFLATSIVGFCPVNKMLGISTLRDNTHDEGHHGEPHGA